MLKKKLTIIGLFLTVLGWQTSFARDVFVSTTTELAAACTNALSGDIIYIASGTYTGPFVLSGKENVKLQSYNGTVNLEGSSSAATNGINIIQIFNSNGITVDSLVFRNNWGNFGNGISISGFGDGINISNSEFFNIGWSTTKTVLPNAGQNAHAIVVVGTTATSIKNVYIGNNYIHDCITGYSESMTIAGNVELFLIEGNTLTGNTNIGIDAAGHFTWTGAPADVNFSRSGIIRKNVVSDYAGPAALDAAGGIYIDGGSFITVENNLVYDYKVGYSVGCEVAGNTNTGNIVRNNIAYNCSLSGLFVGSNTTSLVQNTGVYNNTFYKCGFGTFDNGQLALQNNSGTTISNNIFYPTDGRTAVVQFVGTTSTNPVLSYNMYWRDNGNTDNLFYNVTATNTNAVLANPSFTNASGGDFHISSTSAAVNAGNPSYNGTGQEDLDGDARIQSGRVDIGVDESGSSGTNPNISVTGISISSSTISLPIGSTQTLSVLVLPDNATNTSVNWNSNNSTIATVNTNGLITGQSVGTATITVTTADGGFTDTTIVTVTGNDDGNGGSGTATITIDGNTGDWSNITALATGSGQSATSMKVAEGTDHIYILVEGSGLTNGISRLLINADNNGDTGLEFYDVWANAGVEYMIESDLQYQSTGPGWSWLGLSNTSIDLVKTTNIYEISIEKSSMPNLQIPFKIGFTLDANVAQLPQNSTDLTLFEGNTQGGTDTSNFTPDPNKTYYIDAPHHNLRLAADGEQVEPETVPTSTIGADVEWKFVAKGNGSWHIQRAAGGTLPRLRTDNTAEADMQGTAWNGTYTYYEFEEGYIDGSYFVTLTDGPTNFKRLQVNSVGEVKMVSTASNRTWESFTFTEVNDNSTFSSCTAGTNLALNASIVTYSAQQNTTNGVANLIDGNASNRWSASGFPQSTVIDLGDAYAINEINLAPFVDRAYQFLVEGSTNSATSGFSTLTDARGNTSGGSQINRTFSAQTIRYVRLTITGVSGYTGTWSSIEDFEIICAGNSSSKNLLDETTNLFNIIAYPSPFTNSVSVKVNDTDQAIGSVQLLNLVGSIITSQSSTNGTEVSLNNLDIENGMYLLQVFNTENQLIKVIKLVKE